MAYFKQAAAPGGTTPDTWDDGRCEMLQWRVGGPSSLSPLPTLGVCSSPTIDGDRVYAVTSRCEVVCLDVKGLADGNDGPFRDEGEYIALRVRHKTGRRPWKGDRIFRPVEPKEPVAPLELLPTDADILWRYDFMGELDVWPQDASSCSVLLRGDLLYTCTSNGVDLSHRHIPSPEAPSLIALD
ncbi:PQQ-binding-like beta-propeller repeat protein, partial [Planctomycetota bacterium]